MFYDLSSIKNTIINGDTIEVLKKIPSKSIDLIFADPPYFMQSSDKVLQRADGTGEFKGCDDEWDKYKDYQEYDLFCTQWLKECYRVLKDNGSIWVIGSFQNIYRIGYIMQNIGFWFLNDVIWSKPNPVPNFGGTRFCNSHETMLWCSKGKNNKFTFNYKTMKALNNDKQEKSVWNIGICQGNERLKDENNEKLHNTQKPQSLLEKIVLATSKPNDLILDPFFGTGTTGAAAKKYKRNYIGIDNVQKYIDGATQRINDIVPIENEYSNGSLEVKPPKVSLQTLIDNNYLQLNETFYDKNGKEICKLLEKDKVQDDEDILSIHKMSAKYRNKNNSNGWDYFYVKRNNNFVSINNFRYEYDKKKKET